MLERERPQSTVFKPQLDDWEQPFYRDSPISPEVQETAASELVEAIATLKAMLREM